MTRGVGLNEGCGGFRTGRCISPKQGESRLSYWSISIYTKSMRTRLGVAVHLRGRYLAVYCTLRTSWLRIPGT
jgi:hypothetical protein